MLEFLLLFGFAHVTSGKKIFNCEYNRLTSFPLKIFAINVPPGFNACVATVNPASINCACMNSSKSCRPVTSGAPSPTIKSTRFPSKCDNTSLTLSIDVTSP